MITLFFPARDLPADIILGVDFLRKSQVRLNFPESCATLPSGGQVIKVPFLTSKELSDHQHNASSATNGVQAPNRAYSSNFWLYDYG